MSCDKIYTIRSGCVKSLADTSTPVSIYLKLRDHFPNSLLLESSDYQSRHNSFSYICCNPIAHIRLEENGLHTQFPDGESELISTDNISVTDALINFISKLKCETEEKHRHIHNGLFGYMNYDTVRYFEHIKLKKPVNKMRKTPLFYFTVFQHVIVVDHFTNQLFLYENRVKNCSSSGDANYLQELLNNKNFATYPFKPAPETGNCTDAEFLSTIERGIYHCKRGDVFQIVLSRAFFRKFQGDEFNVYRALRAINPSPYLFYFDYGNFKLFGSSPESQVTISNGVAAINPIAGTYRRSGDDTADALLAEKLKNDPKENAEHIMLVDLARNDLSRKTRNVKVESFREIQYYSHLIHLVSKVHGEINEGVHPVEVMADSFPAGTLSGAPKYRAMELIDRYEKEGRGFYGGAIGYIGFEGEVNMAIMIRSFLSKNNHLFYQAGAGVVAVSKPENELNEVNTKVEALRKAIYEAACFR